MGIDPATTIFIDDNPNNIEVAKSIGMQGIVYMDLEQLKSGFDKMEMQ